NAKRLSRRLQVRPHLSQVNGEQALSRFQLDDEATANQQIEPSVPDGNLLVRERNGNLSLEGDAPKAELDSQRLFVRELEESGTQLAMDLKRSVHDHSSEIVEFSCPVRGVWRSWRLGGSCPVIREGTGLRKFDLTQ